MKKHLLAAGLFVLALLIVVVLFGCGGSSGPGPRDTVVKFTTALSKRNFYDACSQIAATSIKGGGADASAALGTSYSDVRACALTFEGNDAQALLLGGTTIFEAFAVGAEPVRQAKAPKNGYTYKVTYAHGVIYVSVQRDSNGDWKVVGISG